MSSNLKDEVFLSQSAGILTCRKILLLVHGTDGFTFPPKKVMLRTSSLLKIHHFRPGLNPRTLGPMASAITTLPPRTSKYGLQVIYDFQAVIFFSQPPNVNDIQA
jgi:hypothetical protein